MAYITPEGLRNVKKYHYSGIDNSLVANYIMQPFWRSLVFLLPEWIAPNMVTLIGFFFIILSYFATAYYHPSLHGSGPAWLYIWNALCMFVYQTMDALDGKQARRTSTSSPLGELFDHGCDAITTVLGALTLGSSLQVHPTTLLITTGCLLTAFYMAQWEEYYTGSLVLGYVGVTEAQICTIFLNLATAWYGSEWWLQELVVPYLGISIRYGTVPMLITIAAAISTIFSNVATIANSSAGGAKAFAGLTPIIILNGVFVFGVPLLSRPPAHEAYPHTYILLYGFLVANMVGRIVLARVCQEPFNPVQPLVLPSLALLLIAAFHSAPSLEQLLSVYCLVAVGAYLHFALSVINSLCKALHIRCLSIPYRKK